jgi:hypothetical protein
MEGSFGAVGVTAESSRAAALAVSEHALSSPAAFTAVIETV